MKSKIARLNDKKFGFISNLESHLDYFFHATDCPNADFDSMQEGDEVEFEVIQTPKGVRAKNVVKL